LSPLSVFYGALTRSRRALYRKGILKTHDLGVPVVSIGNITAGGTGKTPLVAWFARRLYEEGKRVCILTRGYGRENPSKRIIVSDGKEIFADALSGGDEPVMLAENLIGKAAIISDADRVSAGLWAKENFRSDCFILDDGFQHLRIKRSFDVVAIDATNPFGGENLLPRGRLREPLESLKRADCIIITKTNLVEDTNEIAEKIKDYTDSPVLLTRFRVTKAANVKNKETVDLKDLPQPISAFCAVGNPLAFFSQVKKENLSIVCGKAFRDHHRYMQRDVEGIEQQAKEKGARCLITTAKDAVKLGDLKFELPCYALEAEIEIDESERLRELLITAINHSHQPQ